MTFRCVKLNASWEPIDIISWKSAFDLVYAEKASVLWTYPEEYKIRSQYLSWNYSSIIVLKKFSRRRPEKKDIVPSLKAILIRDLYTCMYCGQKLSSRIGTRDHIVPSSKGGKDSWLNLVACCKECQDKKADKTLAESGLKLIKQPKIPNLSERFSNSVLIASSFERKSWAWGFKKLGLDIFCFDNN